MGGSVAPSKGDNVGCWFANSGLICYIILNWAERDLKRNTHRLRARTGIRTRRVDYQRFVTDRRLFTKSWRACDVLLTVSPTLM